MSFVVALTRTIQQHSNDYSHILHTCRCYSTKDCASFLKTCPFSDDTKKGTSLGSCLPDESDFKKAACSPEAKGKIKSTDGKEVPLKANVTCFQSEKLICEVYKNATGHSFISATCKAAAKKASSAQVSAALWQCCLLLALLVSLAEKHAVLLSCRQHLAAGHCQ